MITSYVEQCDLYLPKEIGGELIKKWIESLAPDIKTDGAYVGFVGGSFKRLNGVMAVMLLRGNGIDALNIPLRYRDSPQIPSNQAVGIS